MFLFFAKLSLSKYDNKIFLSLSLRLVPLNLNILLCYNSLCKSRQHQFPILTPLTFTNFSKIKRHCNPFNYNAFLYIFTPKFDDFSIWQGRRESNSHQKFWSVNRPPSAFAPNNLIIQGNRAFSQSFLIIFNSLKIKNN